MTRANIIKVNAREAHKIVKRLGLDADEDGVTFYTYDETNDEIYGFDTKRERDGFVDRVNNK